MHQPFAYLLTEGGKSNSLGRVNEVIENVLHDQSRLEELYTCLFDKDAWVRMRAADAIEKICRQHPDWLVPYIDRLHTNFAPHTQPSIQWHMAQIYREVDLTEEQRDRVITWLSDLLKTTNVDWIVSANAMETLMQFTKDGYVEDGTMVDLLNIQLHHASKSVVKRASCYLLIIKNT